MKVNNSLFKGTLGIRPTVHLQLGDCGMGMPVIRTWQVMGKLNPGEIVQLSSSHP